MAIRSGSPEMLSLPGLPFNHQTGLQRMREMGATVGSTEMIIYDLLHRAGTPAFKELLPFLK